MSSMKLEDLPIQTVAPLSVHYPEENEDYPALEGHVVEEETIEGDSGDLEVGTEVCIYSAQKKKRPWIGVVTEVVNRRELKINWYERGGRSRKFYPMKAEDGSLYVSQVGTDNVMFWAFADELESEYLELSTYWLKKIAHEYTQLDKTIA